MDLKIKRSEIISIYENGDFTVQHIARKLQHAMASEALVEKRGNITAAAKALGVNKLTLVRVLKGNKEAPKVDINFDGAVVKENIAKVQKNKSAWWEMTKALELAVIGEVLILTRGNITATAKKVCLSRATVAIKLKSAKKLKLEAVA